MRLRILVCHAIMACYVHKETNTSVKVAANNIAFLAAFVCDWYTVQRCSMGTALGTADK